MLSRWEDCSEERSNDGRHNQAHALRYVGFEMKYKYMHTQAWSMAPCRFLTGAVRIVVCHPVRSEYDLKMNILNIKSSPLQPGYGETGQNLCAAVRSYVCCLQQPTYVIDHESPPLKKRAFPMVGKDRFQSDRLDQSPQVVTHRPDELSSE